MSERRPDEIYGLLAEFAGEEELVAAAHAVREAGYRRADAYMPYPSEEVIHAMGFKRSKVPLIVLIGGILGALTGYGLQYWVSAVSYPINVGGRPYNSWVAFIVVTFELHHPVRLDLRGGRDAGAQPPARALPPGVQRAGLPVGLPRRLLPGDRGRGREVRPPRDDSVPRELEAGGGDGGGAVRRSGPVLALLAAALVFAGCRVDMHDQPKYEPLEKSSFFPDASSARQPPDHTVARGELDPDTVFTTGFGPDEKPVAEIPMRVTMRTLERGRDDFNTFCSPCHDRVGTGQGMVVRRGYKQPPTYHQDRLRQAPDGYFFDVITHGFGQMPSYAAQVPVAERWAIVAYIRALQLSQHAPLGALSARERSEAEAAGALPEELTDTTMEPPPGNAPHAGAPAEAAPDAESPNR